MAVLVLLCALAIGLCQEEELAALEAAAAESPAPPTEILCPAKVSPYYLVDVDDVVFLKSWPAD